MKELKLHIGCGSIKKKDYINLDIVEENGGADELLDCSNILEIHPEWEGKVSEIVGYHVFEHFYYDEAIRALEQYYKLLKEGGVLVLEIPDMKRLCQMVALGEDDQLTMAYIFGSHSRENGQVHYWGWSYDSLARELKKAGFFSIIRQNPLDYHALERPCFRVEATK